MKVGAPAEPPLKPEAHQAAMALGEIAALAGVEDAAYLLGSTYAGMLPTALRSQRGVYYTPPLLARRLVDGAEAAGVDWANAKVLDPAAGAGAFLLPIAKRMVEHLRGCNRRVVVRNVLGRLQGFELDPFSAWMSQVFLEALLHERLEGAGTDFLEVATVCDSLTRVDSAEFDLVIGNPPYGRVALSSEQRREFQGSLFGHANLYGVFLDLAIRKARPDSGVVAYVTPTSFLGGEYFKRLRALLGAEANPVSIDFVHERTGVFDGVMQETLLAVYRRKEAKRRPRVHFLEVSEATLRAEEGGEAFLDPDASRPWILPRSSSGWQLAETLRRLPTRLSDWGYEVRTGPLVWNRYKAQMRLRPAKNTVPLVWAEAVDVDGSFSFRAARRNHAPYLAVGEEDAWLLVRSPCVLLQRTTSKEQSRRLMAAELPASFLAEHGAVTVENHLNMLVPVSSRAPAVPSGTLAVFLNSRAADRAFRCLSGSVAVSAYELEALPLPSPRALKRLTTLLGKSPSGEEVDTLCDELYRDA